MSNHQVPNRQMDSWAKWLQEPKSQSFQWPSLPWHKRWLERRTVVFGSNNSFCGVLFGSFCRFAHICLCDLSDVVILDQMGWGSEALVTLLKTYISYHIILTFDLLLKVAGQIFPQGPSALRMFSTFKSRCWIGGLNCWWLEVQKPPTPSEIPTTGQSGFCACKCLTWKKRFGVKDNRR